MTTKSEILHEVRDAMVAAERQHGDQMDVPLGCDTHFAPAAERAKESTKASFAAGKGTWMHIAFEEAMECFAEEDLDRIRTEALQASAMFAQIARVCDYQMEKGSPLKAQDRVYSLEYGWGTVWSVDPGSKLGPIARILWDVAPPPWKGSLTGMPVDLSWARRLERQK